MKFLFKLSLFFTAFYFLSLFCNQQTDRFSVYTLTALPPLSLCNKGPEKEACEILTQPFYYLGTGGQTFVFASQDGKYVLKFFKKLPHPLAFLKKYKIRKKQSLLKDLNSYLLAFQKAPEETGLVFIKMDTKTPFNQKIKLEDKLHISHLVSLQNTLFVLQKRAIPLKDYLNQEKEIKKIFSSLFELAQKLGEKHITDEDFQHLDNNLGFLEKRPLFIDPGRWAEHACSTDDMSKKFMQWIEEKHPDIIPLLNANF